MNEKTNEENVVKEEQKPKKRYSKPFKKKLSFVSEGDAKQERFNENQGETQNGNANMSADPNEEKMYVIPLGGIEEVGKNMTAFQYKDEIIIVDAGLTFPDDEHLGIDVIIPDFTFLENNKEKIKALLLTHGHEDHIGAIPYLYQKLGSDDIPMYG
ncbi:MAG: MBL fold metallo-hydrolase, partial [Leptotrichiaceae bacterium]